MGKRGRVLIPALAVTLLALLAWTSLRRPASEPVYEGKSLSRWLVQLADSDRDVERTNAASAVRHIGTNAIPTLLQMLRSTESPFKTRLLAWRWARHYYFEFHLFSSDPADILERAHAGFDVLGPSAAGAVPELAKILDQNPSRKLLRCIPTILGNIGPEAKAAVPSLLRTAVSTNTHEHFYEFDALGQIHADPDLVVPVLINVMRNASEDRMYAVRALREFRGDAKSAVPALVALLSDPTVTTNTSSPHGSGFVSDRSQVERALQQIDPETYTRIVTNTGPSPTR